MRRATPWVVLLFAFPLVAQAAGFEVHRVSDPRIGCGGAPLDVVFSAPFDDATGSWSDGQDAYYLVCDPAGNRVPISMHRNTALDAVRVAFDDGDPQSAPVDAAQSTVTVSPGTIPADGVTVATVTIRPVDVYGVPLGAGLFVEIDSGALWPGSSAGGVTDLGNGNYEAFVRSSLAGSGLVWITVEGIALSDAPSIEYELAGPETVRQNAIDRLADLDGPGGIFEQLLEGLDPQTDPGADKLAAARKDVGQALKQLQKGQLHKDESTIDKDLKSAVGNLLDVLDDPGAVDAVGVELLIEDLLDIARQIAEFHYDRAVNSCGACDPVTEQPQRVCETETALLDGDAERQSYDPDLEFAVGDYADAVGAGYAATQDCG